LDGLVHGLVGQSGSGGYYVGPVTWFTP